MTSLYTLDAELQQILNMVDSGELSQDDIADQLEAMNMEFEGKAANIGFALANMKSQAEAVKAEASRLKERHNKIAGDVAKLEEYLLNSMIKRGHKKIETDLFTFTYKKPTKVVVIDDEGLLPPECLTEVPASYRVNKAAVKELLNGTGHPAAHLEDSKINLQIK